MPATARSRPGRCREHVRKPAELGATHSRPVIGLHRRICRSSAGVTDMPRAHICRRRCACRGRSMYRRRLAKGSGGAQCRCDVQIGRKCATKAAASSRTPARKHSVGARSDWNGAERALPSPNQRSDPLLASATTIGLTPARISSPSSFARPGCPRAHESTGARARGSQQKHLPACTWANGRTHVHDASQTRTHARAWARERATRIAVSPTPASAGVTEPRSRRHAGSVSVGGQRAGVAVLRLAVLRGSAPLWLTAAAGSSERGQSAHFGSDLAARRARCTPHARHAHAPDPARTDGRSRGPIRH
jgi:hypothetical protein